MHNSEKYVKSLTKNAVAGKLRADIDPLQVWDTEEKFQGGSDLFLEKWHGEQNASIYGFISYFQELWLCKKNGWCEGAALGFSSTDNALEATNAVIKKEHTGTHHLQNAFCLRKLKSHLSRCGPVHISGRCRTRRFSKNPQDLSRKFIR